MGTRNLPSLMSQEQFQKQHIPGSINIPLEVLEEEIADTLPDKGAEIVVHCTNINCPASAKAAAKLEGMGYTDVRHFKEGLEGWQEAGFSLEGQDVGVEA